MIRHSLTCLLLAACAAGCGGGGSSSTAATPPSASGTAATSTAPAQAASSAAATTAHNSSGTPRSTDSGTDSSPAITSGNAIEQAPAAAAHPLPDGPPPGDEPEVHILALVTDGALERYPEALEVRLQHLVAVANDSLARSSVKGRFSLVDVVPVDYPDGHDAATTLDDLTSHRHGLSDVATLREAQEADLVVLFKAYANDGWCGQAWIGQPASDALPDPSALGYAVVVVNCQDLNLAHELGHVLGLGHGAEDQHSQSRFSWGVGYGIVDTFATIMTRPGAYNVTQRALFSNPALDCGGQPCGIPRGGQDAADAHDALDRVLEQVAAWR